MAISLATEVSPPSRRGWSFVASEGEKIYLWGGEEDTEPKTIYIYSINTEAWMREFTKGSHPPANLWNGGCCLSGQHFYMYGGRYGLSYSEALYEMNTATLTWSQLSNYSATGPVGKRGCRMIKFKDQLIIIGGCYEYGKPGKQSGSRYKHDFTNELHHYNLTTSKSETSCEYLSLLVG